MRLLLTLLSSLWISGAFAQFDYGSEGQVFWLGYMENIDLVFNGAPEFVVLVQAQEAGTVTIGTPATGFSFEQDYASGVTQVNFPAGIYYGEDSDEASNFGLKVETSTPAHVYAVHYRLYFTDASIVLPETALSSTYRVMATEDQDGLHASEFVVLATEDNTEVEITPTANTLNLFPAGVAFTITLDAGESYQVQALGDLSGSLVSALGGQNIAVFGGAVQSHVSCGAADNHLWDQTLPVHAGDSLFTPVPFADKDFTVCKVLAHQDGTVVEVGDDLTFSLDAGMHVSTDLESATAVRSNYPVSVSLVNPSQTCAGGVGDPSLLNLLPPRVYTDEAQYQALLGMAGYDLMFSEHHVTVQAEASALPNITLNGANLESAFVPFPEIPGWFYAQVPVEAGDVELNCPAGCQAWATGFGDYDGYTYHLAFIDKEQYTSVGEEVLPQPMVFPNPAENQFTLQVGSGKWHCDLFQADGKWLEHRVVQGAQTWNVDHLSAGIYVLQVSQGGQTRVIRVAVR